MVKIIKLYGKLERIAEELEPTRHQIFYLLGSLKQNSREDILDCVQNQTNWKNYSLADVEKMLKFVQRKPLNSFFSLLNKKTPHAPAQPKTWRFNQGYIRTTAANEVSLDLDSPDLFTRGLRLFDKLNLKGNCRTWPKALGGHISLFFEEPVTPELREEVRTFFGGDPNQVNISVEGKPHHKTGQIVEVVKKRPGLNKNNLTDQLRKL